MYIIGTDVGTTGTKTIVIDEKGLKKGKAYREYELKTAPGGIVSQNADDWWKAVAETIREATADIKDKEEIKAIGLSTQGASMLAVDGNFEPLCEVITWMDQRASEECSYLKKEVGTEYVYEKSGWRLTPAGDASKILWLKNKCPEVFNKARSFVSTVEFVNYKLTGENVTDPTNAGIRQLFDMQSNKWDGKILDAIGIDEKRLPEIRLSGRPVGKLTKDAAKLLGLSENTMVYNGAHDQYCASLGTGAVSPGEMLLSTGTTWVVLGITEKPMTDAGTSLCVSRHPSENAYGALASLVAGGSTLKWFKQMVNEDFKVIDAEAEKRAESSKNLYFYPYLTGSSIAHKIKPSGGMVKGLEISHDKFDLARAIMEGVAFETSMVLDIFKSCGINIKSLMMSGGAAKSRIWSEIAGYATGCDIYRTSDADVCPIGGAVLAAVGCGLFKSYKECSGIIGGSEKLPLSDASMYDYYAEKKAGYLKNM